MQEPLIVDLAGLLLFIAVSVCLAWQIAGTDEPTAISLTRRTIGAVLISIGLIGPILPLMLTVIATGR